MSLDLHPDRPAIAVPVSAPDVPGAVAAVRAARRAGAELVEWRLDALLPESLEGSASLAEDVAAMRAAGGLPILATYRSVAEGGPGELDDDGYHDLLRALVAAGVDAIDVELSRGEDVVTGPVALASTMGVTVVGSSHDFAGTPDDLDARFAELARRGAHVLKVAVTPQNDADVLRLLTAAVRARAALHRAVLPVAMGSLGVLTRVGGALWGAPFTFARVGAGSAPGQLDVAATATVLDVLSGRGPDAGRPSARPVLVLCGPMGSGKSAVGRRVAAALGAEVLDSDTEIEEQTGRTIADIFAEDGESVFREIERDVVVAALGEHEGVLALGGGAVLHPETRAALAAYRAQGGVVVFLDVSARHAMLRLGGDTSRPLLRGAGESPRERWVRIARERRPVYEEVASHTVKADRGTPAGVARRILGLLPPG